MSLLCLDRSDLLFRAERADHVAFPIVSRLTEDVLKRLHQMSSESLAANGESIRHKVLFIASSLLNKYPAQDSAGHEHVAMFLQGGGPARSGHAAES